VNVDIAYAPVNESLFGTVTGITVLIQGNATFTIAGEVSGSLMFIGTGQTVIIRNISLRGHDNNNRRLVDISDGNFGITGGGTFVMEGNSTVTNNNGGGVRFGPTGTFIMKDNSSVSNNRHNSGAGVDVSWGGTFLMQDNATVSNNTARDSGGGVSVPWGTFTMRDNSRVVNNTVIGANGGFGGGVSVSGAGSGIEGKFYFENGIISGNTVDDGTGFARDGGVFTQHGESFVMHNGTISENTVKGGLVHGGGVSTDITMSTFTMFNGTISHNSVIGGTGHARGGGVYATGFILHNGIIANNEVSSVAGGSLWEAIGGGVSTVGLFAMNGGIISGNRVNSNANSYSSGGGVYAGSLLGNVAKTGGIIYGSEASENLRNYINALNTRGHAIFATSPNRWRSITAGENDNSDDFGFWLND
jgi:hypothetical protein